MEPDDPPKEGPNFHKLIEGFVRVAVIPARNLIVFLGVGSVVVVAVLVLEVIAALIVIFKDWPDRPPVVMEAAQQPIGDPRGIDPCTFARPARELMGKFGKVELDGHYGNFNRCDLIVRSVDGSTELDVKFELWSPAPPAHAPRTTKAGRVTIAWRELNDDECHRVLSTPEPYIVDVGVELNSGQHADLCGVADEVTNVVISVLNGPNPLERRGFVPESLGNRDACMLLDAAALARSGVDGSSPDPGFGNWECRWGNSDERSVAMRVSVRWRCGSTSRHRCQGPGTKIN